MLKKKRTLRWLRVLRRHGLMLGFCLWVIGVMLYGAMHRSHLPRQRLKSEILSVDHWMEGHATQATLRASLAKLHAPPHSHARGGQKRRLARFLRHQKAPLSMLKTEAETLEDGEDPALHNTHRITRSMLTLVAGEMIPAVLETALDLEQAGVARAMVTAPVYSYLEQHLLIPAGSRLVGRYAAISGTMQRRVMIVWHRLILPDGTDMRMDNHGLDRLGQSGNVARLDHKRWLQSYQEAALRSLLIKHLGVSANRGVGEGLKLWTFHRHLSVLQGTPMMIMVARDVHWGSE